MESMEYRYLGNSGLKISVLSLGSWITFEQTSEIVKTALELGVNHFDVAESHAGGQAEIDLGLALRNQKGLRRSDFVLSTKVFWGGKGPNDRGLSRKHVFEGTVACLQRLQLDYVDILYAQRPGKYTIALHFSRKLILFRS
ncbi:hypothetical protein HPULCUR_003682 [Helicostylum pulchrum]|uniref:NADP-dependent oxidoreductase domain-containing protein n=1 Tax=Helicostylum pulchrum TaxID=562976 RepID=A0ABP9XU28_9FUNG